jgi:hypothetical protein
LEQARIFRFLVARDGSGAGLNQVAPVFAMLR